MVYTTKLAADNPNEPLKANYQMLLILKANSMLATAISPDFQWTVNKSWLFLEPHKGYIVNVQIGLRNFTHAVVSDNKC